MLFRQFWPVGEGVRVEADRVPEAPFPTAQVGQLEHFGEVLRSRLPAEKSREFALEFNPAFGFLHPAPGELAGEQNVTQLLTTLEVKPEQVAVAINGEVVRRLDWPQTTVQNGDVIEIVRAVGGGSR